MAETFKHASETLPIAINWARYLSTGETIYTATITTPTGLSKEGSHTIDGGKVIQLIKGGTVGKEYRVVFVITTSAGAIYEDTYVVRVIQ